MAIFALPGVHWHQTLELDGLISCGEHAAFIDARGIHAQLDSAMFHCEFLGNLNEVSPHWFWLLRLFDLLVRLDVSGPKVFSATLTSSVVTGQFLMKLIQSNAFCR